MSRGGARPNSGRKGKAEEQKLVERLKPLEDTALEALKEGVERKDFAYLKLYFEYMYGKPKQQMDIDLSGELITVRRPDAK